MGLPTTFDVAYGQNPWVGIDRNQIPYYVPELAMQWRRHNVYGGFTQFAVLKLQNNSTEMRFTELYDLEYDKAPIDNHALWLNAQYFDSQLHVVNTASYGGKVALHKHDPRVTYWQASNGDIRQIAREALGISMTQQIDEMTRDAYLNAPIFMIAGHSSDTLSASGYPNFSLITSSNTFDPDIAASIWLLMDDMMVPGAADPTGLGGRTIFCITSHGVYHDLITDDTTDFRKNLVTLQDRRLLMNYEMGTFLNVRYIKTPMNVLWNCGTITAQTTLTANVAIGSGAVANLWGYTIGQETLRTHSAGGQGQRYISVASASNLAVGDYITISKTRTSDFGVSNGVDYREATLTTRRIVSIDGTNIGLNKPILRCEYETGNWVTKAQHIHATVFIGGPLGVVWAVTQSPAVYTPPVVDDRMAQWRCTWDMTSKPNTFKPEMFYVVYSAGSSAEGLLPH
jgi:hypothetical protein